MMLLQTANSIPLSELAKQIEIEEEHVRVLKDIYMIRCEKETLKAVEKMTGEKKDYSIYRDYPSHE